MLPTKLAFVDIETTGGRTNYDRIIEIGIVRVENDQVIDTYSSLINPHSHIPSEISQLTGIRESDIQNAPSFREIAPEILERLKGFTFVAHNVRFDYGFIKTEFARLGATFTSKHFCTVKLSRTLFPSHTRHNLDSIIERFNLACENRHRALDDALAICTFYHKAKKQMEEQLFTDALERIMKKTYFPLKLDPSLLETLPELPGVYIFYGPQPGRSGEAACEQGETRVDGSETGKQKVVPSRDQVPLYIGKSINIKERVLSHFSGDIHSPLEMKIAQQIESLEFIPTAGELGALFLESQLIKKMLPLFNKMLRHKHELTAIRQTTSTDGYYSAELDTISSPNISDLANFIGFFKSKKQAKDFLSTVNREHELCEKLLGLEKTTTSCFGYRLDRCKGACVKKEKVLNYNLRFMTAFGRTKIKSWPYPGAIIIEERQELSDKTEYFLVDQWCFLGTVSIDSNGSFNETKHDYVFDLDTYKILVRYLTSAKNEKRIRLASNTQQSFSTL